MKVKKGNSNGGYSKERVFQYIKTDLVSQLLTEEADLIKKFVDNKPTEEIEWYRYWFIQEGNVPFEVKLKVPLSKPVFLEGYIFENIEATLFNNTIYFRADSAKSLK